LVASGIAFAFAKATDGITYTDPKWQTNRTASAKAGIAFGGYHFYEPNDEPAPQAANFLAALGDVENMLPPVVDLERTPEAGDEA
jgi:lysozyme